jgi:hypothetical protein
MSNKLNTLVQLCRNLESTIVLLEKLTDIKTAESNLKLLEELSQHLDAADEAMQPSHTVKQNLFSSIRGEAPYAGFVQRLMVMFDLPRIVIERILRSIPRHDDLPAIPWQESGLEGIYLYHFSGGPRVASSDCGLVYLKPGAIFPNHRHLGQEIALVVQGSILEEGKQLYHPGDKILKRAGSQHSFSATDDGPVIISVVLKKGITF